MKSKVFFLSVFLIVSLFLSLYPIPQVKAASATFGRETIGTGDLHWKDLIYASKFQAVDGDGLGDSMTVALRLNVASKTKLRLFNEDFSCVANGDTEERDLPQDNDIEWYTFAFPVQPTITNNAWYWLAWWSENEITAWRDGAEANRRCRDAQSYDGWPCPLTPDNYYSGLLSIYCTYTVAGGEAYTADLSQSVSTSWSVLTEWDAIADVSQSITSSWAILTEWNAILDVSQSLTTSWNVLANLNTFVDLSQAITSTWNLLIGWNAIIDFTQSLTTSWTVLTQTSFNIIASLSNTFSWLVDVVHTVGGGVAYIADLSQAISTTWNVLLNLNTFVDLSQAISTSWTILTQWNAILDLTQSFSTTWTVLIQSSFNIVTSLSNTFTWTVDVLKGVITDYIVDLSLSIVTSWIVDVVHTPWTTIYATKGFVLSAIILFLFIGLPLLGIIIWVKKR